MAAQERLMEEVLSEVKIIKTVQIEMANETNTRLDIISNQMTQLNAKADEMA